MAETKKRIIQFNATETFSNDDYLLIDGQTNGTRKILASNVGSSGGGGIDYSTTEQDTGLKWTDGRTIYQRTFVEPRDSISTGWNSLSSTTWYELYNKIVINHSAIYERRNRVYSGFLMEFYTDNSQPEFYSPFSLNDSGDFKVTIWYIKTTDTV